MLCGTCTVMCLLFDQLQASNIQLYSLPVRTRRHTGSQDQQPWSHAGNGEAKWIWRLQVVVGWTLNYGGISWSVRPSLRCLRYKGRWQMTETSIKLPRTLLQVGFPARARWLHSFVVWQNTAKKRWSCQIFKSCCQDHPLKGLYGPLFLVRTAFFTTWKIQKMVRHQGIWRPLPAGWCSKDPAPMPQKMAMLLSNISNVYQTGP